MSRIVQVDAPSDLEEGFVFDATVDGKTFPVTVPKGGVKRGQTIEVPYPDGITSSMQLSSSTDGKDAPKGRWRNGLCDCCETIATGRFWMGLFLSWVLQGQVMQRFRLNLLGQPSEPPQKHVCMIFSIAILILIILPSAIPNAAVSAIFSIILLVWRLVAGTCTRFNLRQKYQIPGSTFGDGYLDDCCCTFWCGCCTAIQQSRHSHDETVYKYDCCSQTGLGPDAPAIV